MDKNVKTTIIIVIIALVIINIFIFSGILDKPKCIKDVCFYGTQDPYATIAEINSVNSKIIILSEGPAESTQTGSYITKSVVELSSTFALKKPKLISIAMQDSQPVQCYCEDYVGDKFEICDTNITNCLNTQPAENEFLIYLKYPEFQRNEVHIIGNTIEIRAKSGVDQFAITKLIQGMI